MSAPHSAPPCVCMWELLSDGFVAIWRREFVVFRSHRDAPLVESQDIPEDTRMLLGGDVPLTVKARKAKLVDRNLLRSIRFDPLHIYTFDIMQNIFVPQTYEYDVGIARVSTAAMVGAQAVEVMAAIDSIFVGEDEAGEESPAARTLRRQNAEWLSNPKRGDRRYLWRLQLWHEKLLAFLSEASGG